MKKRIGIGEINFSSLLYDHNVGGKSFAALIYFLPWTIGARTQTRRFQPNDHAAGSLFSIALFHFGIL